MGPRKGHIRPAPLSTGQKRRRLEPGLWLLARAGLEHRCLPDDRKFKQTNWSHLEADASAYGEAFAREFGPSGARRLVDSVEIGNEPGKWSDADYTRIFNAMAEGIRAGDPKLTIATCNVTTGKSGDYEKSVSCVAQFPALFDVLNVHTYAQLENWPTWRRSFPEDVRAAALSPGRFKSLRMARRQRCRANRSGSRNSVTTAAPNPAPATGDFSKWVGVTDTQQAQWLVRSLLVFSSMPVERAYIYFFNDEDIPGLHASSGITRHFKPKPSFYALSHLQRVLGDYRFGRIVTNQPDNLRVQEYRNDSGKIIWVAWSPTGDGKRFTSVFNDAPGRLVGSERMLLDSGDGDGAEPARQIAPGRVEATIDESPEYLIFER